RGRAGRVRRAGTSGSARTAAATAGGLGRGRAGPTTRRAATGRPRRGASGPAASARHLHRRAGSPQIRKCPQPGEILPVDLAAPVSLLAPIAPAAATAGRTPGAPLGIGVLCGAE